MIASTVSLPAGTTNFPAAPGSATSGPLTESTDGAFAVVLRSQGRMDRPAFPGSNGAVPTAVAPESMAGAVRAAGSYPHAVDAAGPETALGIGNGIASLGDSAVLTGESSQNTLAADGTSVPAPSAALATNAPAETGAAPATALATAMPPAVIAPEKTSSAVSSAAVSASAAVVLATSSAAATVRGADAYALSSAAVSGAAAILAAPTQGPAAVNETSSGQSAAITSAPAGEPAVSLTQLPQQTRQAADAAREVDLPFMASSLGTRGLKQGPVQPVRSTPALPSNTERWTPVTGHAAAKTVAATALVSATSTFDSAAAVTPASVAPSVPTTVTSSVSLPPDVAAQLSDVDQGATAAASAIPGTIATVPVLAGMVSGHTGGTGAGPNLVSSFAGPQQGSAVARDRMKQDRAGHRAALSSQQAGVPVDSAASVPVAPTLTLPTEVQTVAASARTVQALAGAASVQRGVPVTSSAASLAAAPVTPTSLNAAAPNAVAGTQPVESATGTDASEDVAVSQAAKADGSGVGAQQAAASVSDATASVLPGAMFSYSFAQHAVIEPARSATTPGSSSSPLNDAEPATPSQSAVPLRHLEVTVDDGVLGTVGVRAEMRDGVLHASVSGGADVASAMPELHQFLQANNVAIHTVVQHLAQPLRVSDGASLSSSSDNNPAQNSSGNTGSNGSNSGGATNNSASSGTNSGAYRGGNAPADDPVPSASLEALRGYAVSSSSTLNNTTSLPPADTAQGSRLSIHI